jgi:aminoglycoside 6'-N-acetyltransferase I
MIIIKQAAFEDVPAAAQLFHLLWQSSDPLELQIELKEYIASTNKVIFLAFKDTTLVGVAECGLRYDYVEGTSTSPTGYLEGIYVDENYRKQGIASNLCSACEKWSRDNNCQEFASDCELDNEASLAFHISLGFKEANRIICFTKTI